MKKTIKISFILILFSVTILVFSGCEFTNEKIKDVNKSEELIDTQNGNLDDETVDLFSFLEQTYNEGESFISSKAELQLKDVDGKGRNYTFLYNQKIYTAVYTKDNWHINDSYKIRNKKDITIICQTLIDEHTIHGADMKSYRSAEDMMYEWVQHNIAYDYLPDGNSWKSHTKDVDLNPADQGKNLKEMYESRSGK